MWPLARPKMRKLGVMWIQARSDGFLNIFFWFFTPSFLRKWIQFWLISYFSIMGGKKHHLQTWAKKFGCKVGMFKFFGEELRCWAASTQGKVRYMAEQMGQSHRFFSPSDLHRLIYGLRSILQPATFVYLYFEIIRKPWVTGAFLNSFFFLGTGAECIYEQKISDMRNHGCRPPNVGFFGLGVRQSAKQKCWVDVILVVVNKIESSEGFFVVRKHMSDLMDFVWQTPRKVTCFFFVDDLVAFSRRFHLVGPEGQKKRQWDEISLVFLSCFFPGVLLGGFKYSRKWCDKWFQILLFFGKWSNFIFFSWVETTYYL